MLFNLSLGKLLLILLIFPLLAMAQSFEGSIYFVESNNTDTLHYTYHVKNNFVRIDEINSEGELLRYSVIDMEMNYRYVFDPAKKIYIKVLMEIENSDNNADYEVIKSQNFKLINGYNCVQWRVRNAKKNTEITYWVVEDHFDFFTGFAVLMSLDEKKARYFSKIPNSKGWLPIEIVERSILREEREISKVTDIESRTLDISLFKIPDSYTCFDK